MRGGYDISRVLLLPCLFARWWQYHWQNRVLRGRHEQVSSVDIRLHSVVHRLWLIIVLCQLRLRVQLMFCATVHRCLQCKAPPYLADLCIPVSDVASRQRLRSASSNQLVVPRHRRTQFGRRAFSVAGPMVWNALPDSIRDTALSTHSFRRNLKTLLFSFY